MPNFRNTKHWWHRIIREIKQTNKKYQVFSVPEDTSDTESARRTCHVNSFLFGYEQTACFMHYLL